MKIHELKTHLQPFQAVWDGLKPYEIRKDDRGFEAGDILVLREYHADECGGGFYGGRAVLATIRYVTRGGRWGLANDHIVMAIDVYKRITAWRMYEGYPLPQPPGWHE